MPAIVAIPQVAEELVVEFGDIFPNEPLRRRFAEYLTGRTHWWEAYRLLKVYKRCSTGIEPFTETGSSGWGWASVSSETGWARPGTYTWLS